jgi:hypothetical protein
MSGCGIVLLVCFQLLSVCCESMPVFNNVKKLLIYSDEDRGWQAVPVLLRNCPRLETLIFEVGIQTMKLLGQSMQFILNPAVLFLLSGYRAPCDR